MPNLTTSTFSPHKIEIGYGDQARVSSEFTLSAYSSTLEEEAAVLMESLVNNHGFIEGNSRIAFAAADTFLRVNGAYTDVEMVETYQFIDGALERQEFRFADCSADNAVYAPGHNSFFESNDGKVSWILYHANAAPHQGCANHRSPRAQPFTWNADGTPNFGQPASTTTKFQWPSGEKAN